MNNSENYDVKFLT